MDVRFYFDPICPWCWITSRWLAEEVAPARDLDVDWRSISLLVRNEDKDLSPEHLAAVQFTNNLLRVAEAMRDAGRSGDIGAFYTEVGNRIHRDGDRDFTAADTLAAAGLDTSFAGAFDDATWDAAVRAGTKEAEEVAGDDVGTPIIAYEVSGADGSTEWKGYFGPVIPEVPRGDDALRLWDGLSLLIKTDGFYELKRTRTVGPQIPGR